MAGKSKFKYEDHLVTQIITMYHAIFETIIRNMINFDFQNFEISQI
jgi:hypothetical protein